MGLSEVLNSSTHAFERVVFILLAFNGTAADVERVFPEVGVVLGVSFDEDAVDCTFPGRLANFNETVLGEVGENGSERTIGIIENCIVVERVCAYLHFQCKVAKI